MKLNSRQRDNWFTKGALLTAFAAFTFVGCDIHDNTINPHHDIQAPPVPTGLSSITMNHAVRLTWNVIQMDPENDDLAGYKLYRGNDNTIFDRVATLGPNESEYTDDNLINGHTYYYAISSFDDNGNESELSSDNVFDTPRPEDFDVRIYSFQDPVYWHLSGFDFQDETRLPWNNPSCDFYMEYDTSSTVQAFFLWLGHNGYRIQDMGYTESFDDITFAPNTGWSQFDDVEAISGHTYVIWTTDNHYAKVRVTAISFDPTFSLVFDWGYQVATGNRELKIEPTSSQTSNRQGVEVQ